MRENEILRRLYNMKKELKFIMECIDLGDPDKDYDVVMKIEQLKKDIESIENYLKGNN